MLQLDQQLEDKDRRTCIEIHFIRLELLPLPQIFKFFFHIYSFLKLVPLRIAPKWLGHGPSVWAIIIVSSKSPLCIKILQDFYNYIHWYVWSLFQAIEVHANKISIKINKRPSNPSLVCQSRSHLWPLNCLIGRRAL